MFREHIFPKNSISLPSQPAEWMRAVNIRVKFQRDKQADTTQMNCLHHFKVKTKAKQSTETETETEITTTYYIGEYTCVCGNIPYLLLFCHFVVSFNNGLLFPLVKKRTRIRLFHKVTLLTLRACGASPWWLVTSQSYVASLSHHLLDAGFSEIRARLPSPLRALLPGSNKPQCVPYCPRYLNIWSL